MSGHVDDFTRSGDSNPGRPHGHLEINQDFYVETLVDLNLDSARFAQPNLELTAGEVFICRGALGGLQWLAIQTQPSLCARCNLLLSDLARTPKMTVAQEVQRLICEVRKAPTCLSFKRIPSVQHWQQMVVVTMGDQAHNNRPDGSSAGGLLTLLGGPELLDDGSAGRMTLVSWKTWKLRRVAISSNDAEVQAMVGAEDGNYRTRLLWSQLNGAGVGQPLDDPLQLAERSVKAVQGVVATDSKGGFHAVTLIQAFQLKQSLQSWHTCYLASW